MKKLLLCSILLPCAFSRALSQVNLTNGLVAYYPFNGDANDHSGNNNNPSFNNATPVAGQSGIPNTAYYFNGQNSYMQIPNSPTINFNRQFSFFCRVKPMGFYEGPCHGNNILEKGQDNEQGFYLLRFDDAGAENSQNCFTAQADTLHENFWALYSGVTFEAPFAEENKWYSIAYVSDGTTVSFYLNCVLIASAPLPPGVTLTNGDDLTIGYLAPPDIPFWLNGVIDEIRMYNRPLNIAEINTLSGCPVSTCAPNFTDFNLTPNACSALSAQFSAAFPDSILTAQWDLGDGTTGNTNTITHVYGAPGSYPVKLVVQYKGGCKDSVTKIIPFMAPSPDTSVIITRDTAICEGQQLVLRALVNQPSYCWSPQASLSDPAAGSPMATPTVTTTYYCTTTIVGNNLVYNGDFSKGDTAFASDYVAVSTESGVAEYSVGPTPTSWNSSLSSCTDHTSSSGNMMMISGFSGVANVWSQKVSLQPNTNYLFSGWIQSLSGSNPATLNTAINGAILGNNISASASTCTWTSFSTVWNSGDSTNASLSLTSQGGTNGSLFALDDISFAPIQLMYDSVKVTTAPKPTLQISPDTTICGPYNVLLSATGAVGYSWSPGTALSDSTIANPVATPGITTNYVVTAFDDPGCYSTDSVKVTVLPVPVFGLTPNGSDICQGTSFTLTAQGGDTYQWSSVQQGQGLSTQNSFTADGTVTDTFSVAIYNSTCLLSDTLHSVVTVDTIPVLSLIKSNDIDCSDGQATLTVSGGNGNDYTWIPTGTLSNTNSATVVATPSATTWYTVSVTNGVCSTQDSIQLLVDYGGQTSKFTVPDAFTPNGDGINDCFKVQYWGVVKSFELSVFNRWGVRVFYTQNLSDCWDGRFNGVEQPSGAYIYQIKAASPCAASGYIFRKGTLALMR